MITTAGSLLRRVLRPFLILLALVFLLEAWLWTHLEPIVAWAVRLIPLQAVKARIAAAIERLSPTATLIVFTIPFVVLFPLKFLEFWLLAHRHWVGAILTLIAAKLLGLGITAFVFAAARPKLLQMPWFARFYGWVMWLLERAHALIDPLKERIRMWLRLLSPARAGRAGRLFRRIRRRMQGTRPAV
jgi:hypothetical protein